MEKEQLFPAARQKVTVFFDWRIGRPCGASVDDVTGLVKNINTKAVTSYGQRVIQGGGFSSCVRVIGKISACQGYIAVDALDYIAAKTPVRRFKNTRYLMPSPERMFGGGGKWASGGMPGRSLTDRSRMWVFSF